MDTRSNFYIEFELNKAPTFGDELLVATEDRKDFVNNIQNCYKADIMTRKLLTKNIPVGRGEIKPKKKNEFSVAFYPFPMIKYPQELSVKIKFKSDDSGFLQELDEWLENLKFRGKELIAKMETHECHNLDINKNKLVWVSEYLGSQYQFLIPSAMQKKSDNDDTSIYYLFSDIVKEKMIDCICRRKVKGILDPRKADKEKSEYKKDLWDESENFFLSIQKKEGIP